MADLALATAVAWTRPSGGFGEATIVVNPAHPQATDDTNPSGTKAKPRKTIPTLLPAGSVVDLSGPYATSHQSPRRLLAHGTPTQPVAIRSGAWQRGQWLADWELSGSYVTVQNLQGAAAGLTLVAPFDHVAITDVEFAGNGTDRHGLSLASYDDQVGEQVVLARVSVHHQGDVQASYDQDFHGLSIGARVSYVWVLDSDFSFNSGDGVQINAGLNGRELTHHVYFEGNTAHDNKQCGFWVKQASDVLFLRNESWNHRTGNSSLGAAFGQQYAPENVWWLENHGHDSDRGLLVASDQDLPSDGVKVFVMGNTMARIRPSKLDARPDDPWQPAAYNLEGSRQRYVFHNSASDAACGYAVNGFALQQTFSFQNRAVNVPRPVVGPLIEVNDALVDRVVTYYKQRYQV